MNCFNFSKIRDNRAGARCWNVQRKDKLPNGLMCRCFLCCMEHTHFLWKRCCQCLCKASWEGWAVSNYMQMNAPAGVIQSLFSYITVFHEEGKFLLKSAHLCTINEKQRCIKIPRGMMDTWPQTHGRTSAELKESSVWPVFVNYWLSVFFYCFHGICWQRVRKGQTNLASIFKPASLLLQQVMRQIYSQLMLQKVLTNSYLLGWIIQQVIRHSGETHTHMFCSQVHANQNVCSCLQTKGGQFITSHISKTVNVVGSGWNNRFMYMCLYMYVLTF